MLVSTKGSLNSDILPATVASNYGHRIIVTTININTARCKKRFVLSCAAQLPPDDISVWKNGNKLRSDEAESGFRTQLSAESGCYPKDIARYLVCIFVNGDGGTK